MEALGLQRLIRAIDGLGLAFRGAFHPEPVDGAPPLADGTPTLTVVLLGWTGGDQWPVFTASPEFRDGLPDPLNRWSKRLIDGVASVFGAAAFYPFGGPPWLDFQSWALKAGPVHRSPLGLLIHPQWGLWHSYRGALGLREHINLDPRVSGPHPCEQCVGRMTPIGTPELVLLLVALGGMTGAATWAVIELKKPRR